MCAVLVAALLSGCGDQAGGHSAAPAQRAVVPVSAPADAADEQTDGQPPSAERYLGDLDALQRRGRLRILIPANVGGVYYLPRDGWPVTAQLEAAQAFARSQGLEPELVPVSDFADLIPALLDGRGDLIAANLTVTEQRRRRIAFSVPITTVRKQLLVASASANAAVESIADLVGKRVMVNPGTAFWESLRQHSQAYPGIELIPRPAGLSDEEALDRVASGEVDASVRDSNVAAMYIGYRDDLRVAFSLPGVDDIAWGLRRDAPALQAALNRFLHLEWLVDAGQAETAAGWQGIRERRRLRVLMRNNAASYFLYRGELQGFEYELAKAFADAHRLRLEVVVPSSQQSLLDALRAGDADLAAGYLEPYDDAARDGIAFSRPYHFAARHLVVRDDDELDGIEDLHGRTVTVRRSSPYWQDLVDLQRQGVRLHIDIAAEDVETEELIAAVARGAVGATMADGHLLDIELARGLAVRSGVQLSENRAHAVAIRAGEDELLDELNAFIKQAYRGVVYNILRKKYFSNPQHVADLAVRGAAADGGLSPYDEITRHYAEQYGFDWRLITAQMYQESRFDPEARSFAGAFGLMQVMPKTARFMGFDDIDDAETGIHAGIKYLDWVRNRFEPELGFNDRLWFSLAAYNAGHGHVQDARRLARKKGWNGDRWFDNVEKAMLLLSRKQYASKARHGYVRGTEPVSYVRDIRQRYRAYLDIMGDRLAQSPLPPGSRTSMLSGTRDPTKANGNGQ
jgi:membrane-bound lytic murein transglycosylase F